ncbi:MAG: glycosyltransferase [Anaerolineaceae bacterium]|nr:glycosyltransferase [Anaerolineaceae bacterium]
MLSQSLSTGILTIIIALYCVCIVILSLYGFNSLGLAIIYLITSNRKPSMAKPSADPKDWPVVTIQLPIYNESSIITRLLEAVTGQDYPRNCFEIQVLDDSTDETTGQVRKLVDDYRSQGFDICIIHRTVRDGYKAGALSEGLKTAKGDYLAIFDADFVPPPDWLRKVMRGFGTNPKIGCVQSRWGHLNYKYNLLTNAEGLGLDAHFLVEQNARARTNMFLGFNGSGGIWRKACILDSGGWQSDTLTEDLDLSYRAQLKGWEISYLPEIVVPGELPAQVDAFKNQQYRWAKGSAQTFRKLIWQLMRSKTPWHKRLMGIMHLSMYMPFPFIVATLLLTLPVALYASHILNYFGWTMVGSLGPPLLYTVARSAQNPRFRDRLVRLPALLLIGLGVSLNSSFAVISGIFSKGGVFHRTPKFNLRGKKGQWASSKYALPTNPVVYGEVLLALYAAFTVIILWHTSMGKVIAPGMVYYAISYLFMASLSFTQSWQLHRSRSDSSRDPF